MISIIIPLYNKELIIRKTLDSILSQDNKDFEIIVVDDGSTDNSISVVQHLSDLRIRIIKQENGGPSKARNTGIRAARGEWLYFIDADDEMEPGALSHFDRLTREHPDADMLLGEISFFNGKKRRNSKQYDEGFVNNAFKEHFMGRISQCSGSSLYKRSVCEKDLYNEDIRRFEDLECLFRRYRHRTLYLTHHPVAIVNVEYAAASHGRKDIKEDFLGHLNFKGKSFWERMCLYQLFLSERPHYPKQCRKLYPQLYHRWDYYLMYHFLSRSKNLWL